MADTLNSPLVPVMVAGWFLTVLFLFMFLPARRAVLAAVLGAWLFLPVFYYEGNYVHFITKPNVIALGVLTAVMVFDLPRVFLFRPRWFDLPVAAMCLTPLASSLSNGLGAYDGISAVVGATLTWGAPYFIGRLYFTDLAAIRELVIAVFIAGIVYMPLCLYEVRMSPQLHYVVYGYHQHDFMQTVRFGGWRPMVFMEHGLMVGMFMTSAALCGFWLWRTHALTELATLPVILYLIPLFATVLLIKSAGSIILLVAGVCALLLIQTSKSHFPLFAIIAIPVVYIALRTVFLWSAEPLAKTAGSVVPQRAQSLEFRFKNENAMAERALQRPLFGWGGWDRARVRDKNANGNLTTTDSLWIIAWGNTGYTGLVALMLMILLPPILLRYRVPPKLWTSPKIGPLVVIALILALWMNDSLLNSMIGPIYPMMSGALFGVQKVMVLHPLSDAKAANARLSRPMGK